MASKQIENKGQGKAREVAKPVPDKSRSISVVGRVGVTAARTIAECAFDPAITNASTALDYAKGLFSDLSLDECANVVRADSQCVNDGDLGKFEAMLAGQATALNAMFNNFAKRAIHADVMPKLDAYFRLALKAQAQCRSTVEAIAEIKYPKSATFIKQANIAGQQQVNNSGDGPTGEPASPTREKNITPTNELIKAKHANLDKRATGTASRSNPPVETVGTVNRASE